MSDGVDGVTESNPGAWCGVFKLDSTANFLREHADSGLDSPRRILRIRRKRWVGEDGAHHAVGGVSRVIPARAIQPSGHDAYESSHVPSSLMVMLATEVVAQSDCEPGETVMVRVSPR